ncbi:hypothetical protein P7K49_024850 [Saguinus oedipus]|uniref:Uncharacterized protein n=1 Tax=Saguinus oedipus TaxID=9490 RepID=A0ABQ9UFI7_SAGOE|nr:hypothetical protein P7K49_024850 [Saguinus oedipus]
MTNVCKTTWSSGRKACAQCDQKDKSPGAVPVKLVANVFSAAGLEPVSTVDMHTAQVQGFFSIAMDDLHVEPGVCGGPERILQTGGTATMFRSKQEEPKRLRHSWTDLTWLALQENCWGG